MIYYYMLSIIILSFVLILKKITLKDYIHWLYLGFNILYNFFPYLRYITFSEKNRFSLILSRNNYFLIREQLLIAICVNIFYTIYIFIFYKKIKIIDSKVTKKMVLPEIVYVILYPLALYLAKVNNWTTGLRTGIGPSITAHLMNFLLVLSIVIFNKYPKFKNYILISYIILSIISTQRTGLFLVCFAYVFTLQKTKKIKIYILLFLLLILIIGSLRNGVNFYNLLYPIYGEAVFGSYGLLQSIKILQEDGYTLKNLILPINEILYRIGIEVETIGGKLNGKALNYLNERYFPMGGYYYCAGSHYVLPYIGPILHTFLILKIIEKVCLLKGNKDLQVLLYASLFLFFKATFFIALKYIFVCVTFYYVYMQISIALISLKKRLRGVVN